MEVEHHAANSIVQLYNVVEVTPGDICPVFSSLYVSLVAHNIILIWINYLNASTSGQLQDI